MDNKTLKQFESAVKGAQRVVVVQADNPDADSLASSLILEHILGDMGKEVSLYCGVDIPLHLRYLNGWDRINKELPKNFDLSIIVDTSTQTLLEQLQKTGQLMWLKTKPCVVIDHHQVEMNIDFATLAIVEKAVSTGEIIYHMSAQAGWQLDHEAKAMTAVSILADSLGLTSEGTLPSSIRVIADLLEQGVDLAELESLRRKTMQRSPELIRYKGELLQRIEYFYDDQIATLTIPWKEIETYSHAYNPAMLAIDEMRLAEGNKVAIVFKVYSDGKITAKIRCNYGYGIANDLAKAFGGGGHPYASGFKMTKKTSLSELKPEVIQTAWQLIEKLESKDSD